MVLAKDKNAFVVKLRPTNPNPGSVDSLPNEGRGSIRGLMRGLVLAAQEALSEKAPVTTLQCSLTFINVTWQSIVNDLTEHVIKLTRTST